MVEVEERFVYMIFEFKLSPLENVHPWGDSPNRRLSWFILTQGDYRLRVGSQYLLNYSEAFNSHQIEKFPEYSFHKTFVDYYVVRLWEDILEIVSSVIEPVPEELQHFLESGYEKFLVLNKKATDWQEAQIIEGANKDEVGNVVELSTGWLNDRWLDSAYLSPSSRIWIWSDETDVIISWDNQEITFEEISVWSATCGNYRINKVDFINEVREFNRKLFTEMSERVTEVCRTWQTSEVNIDVEHLKYEQKDRATWLEYRLKNSSKPDWDKIISAINSIT